MKNFALSLLLMIVNGAVTAQESNPMPALKDDLTAIMPQSNSWFKSFTKPAFLQVGLLGGVYAPLSGRSVSTTGNLRGEYGFSTKFSLMTNVQFSQRSAFQSSTALRWMPFTSRVQPFIGAGWGFASGHDGDGHGHCHHQTLTTNTTTNSETVSARGHSHEGRAEGFAVVQTGVNYSVSKHFVAHAEAFYQTKFSRYVDATGLRLGLSYQFGK